MESVISVRRSDGELDVIVGCGRPSVLPDSTGGETARVGIY